MAELRVSGIDVLVAEDLRHDHADGIRHTHTPCPACNLRRPCEWFALCDRQANVLVPHPVLGEVPSCDRCQEVGQ